MLTLRRRYRLPSTSEYQRDVYASRRRTFLATLEIARFYEDFRDLGATLHSLRNALEIVGLTEQERHTLTDSTHHEITVLFLVRFCITTQVIDKNTNLALDFEDAVIHQLVFDRVGEHLVTCAGHHSGYTASHGQKIL